MCVSTFHAYAYVCAFHLYLATFLNRILFVYLAKTNTQFFFHLSLNGSLHTHTYMRCDNVNLFETHMYLKIILPFYHCCFGPFRNVITRL